MSNNIELKTVQELINFSYFIPSYQRGYRWTKDQTTDLLQDVWEFINKPDKREEEWYCLQPVVVKEINERKQDNSSFLSELQELSLKLQENDALPLVKKLIEEFEVPKKWEVIDGQQRLTTLYLLLQYLKINPFSIAYETREDSTIFLDNIHDRSEEDSADNIDFYHIFHSFRSIHDWFTSKSEEDKKVFSRILLEKVKVIWYKANGDSIDIFTRINSGKIPLTNAELIKALFLNSSNFRHTDSNKLRLRQLEIASEWDRIEYTLQGDPFWYFVNKDENKLATRIEFLFNLMYNAALSNDSKLKEKFGADDLATFRFFQEKFKHNTDDEIKSNWDEVKKLFQCLEEWYNERELYHKIGYLITIGVNIQIILGAGKDRTKIEFRNWLNVQIKVRIEKIDLNEVVYGGGNVWQILLLHNIQTMLNNKEESSYFPFDRFKKENWDVEHIHAIATDIRVEKKDQKVWLKNNFVETEEYTDESMNQQIDNFEGPIEADDFSKLVAYVLKDEEDNSINNLCLLDRGTNRSYKNASFRDKRMKIIEREMRGTFIPICTKNVFMKYYSKDVKGVEVWNDQDRSSYRDNIKKVVFDSYLNPSTDNE